MTYFFPAPCPPQNVTAQVNCMSNDLTISWDAIREAEYFLVSVTEDNGGSRESYNTTTTACSISNLTCGNTFGVQVTSVRGDCRSRHSQTRSIMSGMKPVEDIYTSFYFSFNLFIQSPVSCVLPSTLPASGH